MIIQLFKGILLSTIIYLYIFAPPLRILPFNPSMFLNLLCIVYIYYNELLDDFLKLFNIEFIFLTIIILYSLIRGVFSGEILTPVSNLLIILAVFLPSYCLITYYRNNFTHHFVTAMIIPVLVASSLISVYLFLNPELNLFIKYDVLKYDIESLGSFLLRGFGFGAELLFGYALVHGIGCALCLVYLRKNIYLLLPAILFLFPVIVNARIGLVPVIVGVLLALRTSNNKVRFIAIFIVLVMITVVNTLPFESDFKKAIEMSMSFFTETSDYLHGSGEGTTYEALFRDMFVLPASLGEWIYGKGTSIFLAQDGSSDVGYILQLNFGGLPYLLIIMTLIVYMPVRIYKLDVKWLAILMLVVLMIGNLKGNIMNPTPTLRFIILLYTYYLINSYSVKQPPAYTG